MIAESRAVAAVPKRDCFLRSYVRYAAASTDANVAYHIPAALVLLSQSTPLTFFVPYGQPLYVNIYALLVGPSTLSRKSAAISLARRVLTAAIPLRVADMPGSPEGLVDALDANPQQAIFYSEFGSLLAQAERGYLMPLKTRLTEAYDCTPIGRRKANGKGVVAKDPRLSILGGVAPGYLERHTEEVDWTEGFTARFLTIYAQRERHYLDPTFDEAGEAAMAALLKGHFDGWSTMQTSAGKCLGVAENARSLWREWQGQIEDIAQNGPPRPTRPALARAPGMAMKIAGLLGWDFGDGRSGAPWWISEEMLTYATRIVDLHVASVLEVGDLLATDRDMRDRRRVLAAINNEPTALGDILRRAQITKKRARDLIETLVEEGTIRYVAIENLPGAFYVRGMSSFVGSTGSSFD